MLYILRHGETRWNVQGRMQGSQDSPLTERGRGQAQCQGDVLRANGGSELPVFCSPQPRAIETARIALPGAPIREDGRLCEVAMGQWQGLTMDEIEEGWPDALTDPHPFLWKFFAPGGERLEAAQARVRSFLSDCPASAVIVTHGVTALLLRGQLLGADLEEMACYRDGQGAVYRVADGQQTRLERT
ncbi:putative phosphoglycerate mutase [Aliiruegeria haliotis]|uniref:Putative phosphoglycerate mutase n=1 Tax=Aliiruegeria haliotis TaxID=1280846 RepID=A0A2T0RV23_9RHOB|nr:histidine phosphatase family protein [Aliiruegeria haliotis]PRY24903.1 putative phosphoglycerate mutase [Aliiruegeria haliotis]